MDRTFIVRTDQDNEDAIVEAIAGRENELASYDANIVAYEQQLVGMDASLPAEWPAELAKYRGRASEQVYAIGGSVADMELASKLNHRDRVRMLLFTEKAERAKSDLAYQHVLSQLTTNPAKRTEALGRYATKLAAQKAKNP